MRWPWSRHCVCRETVDSLWDAIEDIRWDLLDTQKRLSAIEASAWRDEQRDISAAIRSCQEAAELAQRAGLDAVKHVRPVASLSEDLERLVHRVFALEAALKERK